jgi:hypothetical protein
MKSQAQLEFPQFKGEALTQLPDDLFIPARSFRNLFRGFFWPNGCLALFNSEERY